MANRKVKSLNHIVDLNNMVFFIKKNTIIKKTITPKWEKMIFLNSQKTGLN